MKRRLFSSEGACGLTALLTLVATASCGAPYSAAATGSGGGGAGSACDGGAGCDPADDGGSSSTSSTGTGGNAPTCVPEAGPDLPDDDFKDTNCDGIDGDKAAAIFVAPSGSDNADGSFDAPVATLATAVALAGPAGKSIYACSADYPEPLVVSSLAISVYGGFDCMASWSRTSGRAVVSPATGTALRITDVTASMVIDGVDFVAADALLAGESSIGAIVVGSPLVTLSRTEIAAGNAQVGITGAEGAPFPSAAFAGVSGGSLLADIKCDKNNPVGDCGKIGTGGASPQANACAKGGKGGDGGNIAKGQMAAVGLAGSPGGPGGAINQAGSSGGSGMPGSLGSGSLLGYGVLTQDGYSPVNVGTVGKPGTNGTAGGGGGGRVSVFVDEFFTYYYAGGGGGQGAAGGCGGKGGAGGGGGGASIALFLLESPVVLKNATVKTGAGGTGGVGGAGGQGQLGGTGGAGGKGTEGVLAGKGGNGGKGGVGGAGGPGGGGPTLGIVVEGSAHPTLEAVQFQIGTPGVGGISLGGADGADGIGGESFCLVDGVGCLGP